VHPAQHCPLFRLVQFCKAELVWVTEVGGSGSQTTTFG